MLNDLHAHLADHREGDVATYIPELSRVDPELIGIALVSLHGRLYQAGDAEIPFTIQSVSKPFVYALALVDHGLERLLERVGAEPSGEAFNAISLDPVTGRPDNPMINAGAIVTTSMVKARTPADRFERIRHTLSAFAGRPLIVDERVYRSESLTGDKNRALGYLMRNAGSLTASVDETLDVYFRQCSLLVTTVDVAVMAATLANRGVNPVTRERVVPANVANQVLSMMATCGMYDHSGEWLLRVGLPAKSGVSGAVVAASPGQFGIGIFSPRLDAFGNSVRAVDACRELSSRFDLHMMPQFEKSQTVTDQANDIPQPIDQSKADGTSVQEDESAIVVRGCRGALTFHGAERLLHSLEPAFKREGDTRVRWLILDFHRVDTISRTATAIVSSLVQGLEASGIGVVLVNPDHQGEISTGHMFDTLEAATTWCEDQRAKRGSSANRK